MLKISVFFLFDLLTNQGIKQKLQSGIKLKLASLNRGYLLTKPIARQTFESNSPDITRLCLKSNRTYDVGQADTESAAESEWVCGVNFFRSKFKLE